MHLISWNVSPYVYIINEISNYLRAPCIFFSLSNLFCKLFESSKGINFKTDTLGLDAGTHYIASLIYHTRPFASLRAASLLYYFTTLLLNYSTIEI